MKASCVLQCCVDLVSFLSDCGCSDMRHLSSIQHIIDSSVAVPVFPARTLTMSCPPKCELLQLHSCVWILLATTLVLHISLVSSFLLPLRTSHTSQVDMHVHITRVPFEFNSSHRVALSPQLLCVVLCCDLVILLSCYLVILLYCYIVILLSCYLVILKLFSYILIFLKS